MGKVWGADVYRTHNQQQILGTTNILSNTLHTPSSSFISLMLQDILANLVCACARVLMTTDFPPPVGPTTMVVCHVNIVSYSWTTLSAWGEEKREK